MRGDEVDQFPSRPIRGEYFALARRLVDVLWALLRDGREFTLDKPALAAA